MFLLYDIIFIIFALGYMPFFILKLSQVDDKKRLLFDRLSFYSSRVREGIKGRETIWIHAVSVGETLAVKDFLNKVHDAFPEHRIVFSTVTPTGNRVAKKIVNKITEIIYFPLDISFITNRVIRFLHPSIVILMETELWPNLILSAHKSGAKIVIVNGRLSPKSFRSYYRVKGLLHSVFQKIDLYLMQTEKYAKRLKKIGVPDNKVFITGNMKFDNIEIPEDLGDDYVSLKRKCGFGSDDLILIAASTHRGEEAIIVDIYSKLHAEFPHLKMLIAPRHIERTDEIIELLNKYQLSYKVADLSGISEGKISYKVDVNNDVYMLNTIGDLKRMYAIGDVVFMGGSLVKHGGQNPLEAIGYKKPIVTGRHVFNFSDIYQTLFELGAAVKVDSPNMCLEAIREVIFNEEKRYELSKKAYAWLCKMKGASEKNFEYVRMLLGQT